MKEIKMNKEEKIQIIESLELSPEYKKDLIDLIERDAPAEEVEAKIEELTNIIKEVNETEAEMNQEIEKESADYSQQVEAVVEEYNQEIDEISSEVDKKAEEIGKQTDEIVKESLEDKINS